MQLYATMQSHPSFKLTLYFVILNFVIKKIIIQECKTSKQYFTMLCIYALDSDLTQDKHK